MSLTYVQYVADGTTAEFDVPFPFANRTHVKVKINGASPIFPVRWVGESRIELADSFAAGSLIEVWRETPLSERLVDFQNGSVLTEEELDLAINQVFYLQQELKDTYDRGLGNALSRVALNNGLVTVDPNAVIEELANLVISEEVVGDLRQAIADIGLNAESIADQALNTDNLNIALGQTSTSLTNLRADHELLVRVVDALAGGDPGTGLATLIQDETNARIQGDTALAETIAIIGAKSNDGLAFIFDTSKVRVSPTETLATRLSTISATASANAAAIQSEQTARISGDTALTTQINALTARVDTNEASILSEQTARADADTAFASTIALLGAKNGSSTAFVLDTSKVQIGGGETLATRFSALTTADNNALSLIQSEQTSRINADNVLTSSVNSLGSRLGTAEAAIVTEQNARIAGDQAEASARTALAARVTTAEGNITANSAAITNEATVRAAADSSFASQLSLLGAQNAGGTAWILDLAKVRVDGTTSLGTRLSGIDTQIANNAATIASEQTARVSGDNALASQITTLTTTVNGNTASVNTLQSSVNGLQARYGVSLDVNGYVTGFLQNNNGTSGDFIIVADRFAVVSPGVSPIVPFEVSGGIVRIKEAAIGTLSVGRLSTGTLGANVTQNGDWLVGTGKIIWDNGTYMKVAGVGFGTSNQFIEWFGPKMAISLCSEANAIQYLKANGDAYFGGTLSAGILKNAAQSTSIDAGAAVTVGPFGSNGKPIQVVTSYYMSSEFTNSYDATISGYNAWESAVNSWGGTIIGGTEATGTKPVSCNVVVTVTKDGAAFATLTITSSVETIQGFAPEPAASQPGYLTFTRIVSGSITSTDNSGGTSNRSFTATITTRTSAVIGSVTQQRVSIISTEE